MRTANGTRLRPATVIRRVAGVIVAVVGPLVCSAQTDAWIRFRDKPECTAVNATKDLSPATIKRRQQMGLDLWAPTDCPVSDVYINDVSQFSDSIWAESRWLNGIGVWGTETELSEIARLACVRDVKRLPRYGGLCVQQSSRTQESSLDKEDIILLRRQTSVMGRESFWRRGLKGDSVIIAILDAGFKNADSHGGLSHLEGRIIGTRNFVRNQHDKTVFRYDEHGTMVLSCIAGIYDDSIPMGLAPNARFLLGRTEELLRESVREEFWWIEGLEWAERNGARLVNSSLGYTASNYFPWQLDGRTSIITRGANTAAQKGVLVVSAAGNEADTRWQYLGFPADADSILTVGGIDPETMTRIYFSSIGPTADHRRKPNVSAFGSAIVANDEGYENAHGTSFAAPFVTGFAACVIQSNPRLSPLQLIDTIQASGHLYPYFDFSHGYGIPDAGRFLSLDTARLPQDVRFVIDSSADSVSVCFEMPIDSTVGPVFYQITDTCARGEAQIYYYSAWDIGGMSGKCLNFPLRPLGRIPPGPVRIRLYYDDNIYEAVLD